MNNETISLLTLLRRLRALGGASGNELEDVVNAYKALHQDSLNHRRHHYEKLVNHFYYMANAFYEYGWGKSLHFAPRLQEESLRESLLRYELKLAQLLQLTAFTKTLDVGCGIGGPMRAIAGFSGGHITGINNNASQVVRATQLNLNTPVENLCEVIKGDFMEMPFSDASFDAAYAIEATVHAPNLVQVYKEIRRVLKPGGIFCSFEWCLTAQFKSENEHHKLLKKHIEIGNGLPDINTTDVVLQALKEAGFTLIHHEDYGIFNQGDIPWWQPLRPNGFSLATLRSSEFGGQLIHSSLSILEFLRLVPKGTASVAQMLAQGGSALASAGEEGLFTPSFLILARK